MGMPARDLVPFQRLLSSSSFSVEEGRKGVPPTQPLTLPLQCISGHPFAQAEYNSWEALQVTAGSW